MNGTGEKTIISAQMPTIVRDRLADLAAAHERSLSGEVRRAVDTYLRLNDPGFSDGATSGLFVDTAGTASGAAPAAATRRDT